MAIFLHLIWTMILLATYLLLEVIIGEEQIAISLIRTFIQVEKMEAKLLIMIAMEFLELTVEENLMKNYSVLSLRDSELQ
jgi:hypothetical protein